MLKLTSHNIGWITLATLCLFANTADAQYEVIIHETPIYSGEVIIESVPATIYPIYGSPVPISTPYAQPLVTSQPAPVITNTSYAPASLEPMEQLSVAEQCRNAMQQHNSYSFGFDVNSIDGVQLNNDSYKGRLLIVAMWASWCTPCRAEIPHLIALQNKYGKQGLSILGLANEGGSDFNEMTNVVRSVKESDGINYRLALGNDAINQQVPDFGGFPTLVIMDRSGIVRMTITGYEQREKLEMYVKLLLAEEIIVTPSNENEPAKRSPFNEA